MKHQPTAPAHLTPAPAEETHIHHHEDPTILARWLRIGMEQGPIFWGGLLAVVAAIAAGVFFTGDRGAAGSSGQDAWAELAAIGENPTDAFFPGVSSDVPTELRELADAHPDSAAAAFARLQAASLLLKDASGDLATTRRSDGVGKLLEADELFAEVLRGATNPTLKRIAALGAARTAEARLGLDLEDTTNRTKSDEVISLYKKVAADYPGTPEADRAEALAARLADPDCIAFYDALAKFDPNAAFDPALPTVPPGSAFPDPLAPGQSGSLMDMLNPGLPAPAPAPAPSDLPAPSDALPPALSPPEEATPTEPPAAPTGPPAAPPSDPAPRP